VWLQYICLYLILHVLTLADTQISLWVRKIWLAGFFGIFKNLQVCLAQLYIRCCLRVQRKRQAVLCLL